jgi:hypothetical protein
MGFLDLFRPKWKHSDAEVRAEAVKSLTSEDQTLLAQVLKRDPDARVRRLALKKIDDPQLLGEVASEDPDEELRRDASEKAQSILQAAAISERDEARSLAALERLKSARAIGEVAKRAGFESVRRAALARVDDAKALADVARRSDDPHVRRQAVERLSEAAALRDIAIGDAVKEVGLAAVERLDDQQALENVAKKSRLKAVKAAAREKLEKMREAERPKDGSLPAEKRRAQLALAMRSVEEAAASDDLHHAERAFELAKGELARLGVKKGEEAFQKRYDRAWLKYQTRVQEAKAHDRAVAAAEVQKQRAAEEQEKRAVEAQAHAAEDAKLREIADAARKEEDERRAAERARRAEEKAKREAEKAERDKQKAEARQKKEAEARDNLKRLEEAALRLEGLVADEHADKKVLEAALKSTDEVVKAAGKLPKDEGGDVRERHRQARAKLNARLQEMKESEDWKRWANVPKLEALVAKMEALLAAASAEGADQKQAAALLKELQTEWKSVGAAPKDKSEALWKRFKATADQVYERVKAGRAIADEERAANLKKKEELCARVEALAATPDAEMHWKETAETIKALQEEWKSVGPVAKEQSDAIWKRFRASCDQFFERRKAHLGELDAERGEHLKQQEALAARAEALASVPDDKINWKETAEQLKALQAEWKNVGPGPKEQSEAVWKRFRAACDQFFERRKQRFDALDAERADNLKQKQLLCEKAEALADADDLDAAMAEAKKLQAEWKATGPAPKEEADAIWSRFRAACDVVFERARNPQLTPLEPEAPAAPASTSKFENKLPLQGIVDQLQAAADEWTDIATGVTKDKKLDDK